MTRRRNHTVYHAVQVAASDKPEKATTQQMLGHFRKAKVPAKRIVREFPVTPDAHVPVGESRVVTLNFICASSKMYTKEPPCLLSISFQDNSWM